MDNSLSQKFTFTSLVKYAIPAIITMLIMSFYSMVDGIFVSRFVSTDALSAVNIIYPVLNILIGMGLMFATGSSAIIAKKLGENKQKEANESFTQIIVLGVIVGLVFSVVGFVFRNNLIYMLGGEGLYEYCKQYLNPILYFAPFFMLNLLYQILAMTAGKPGLSLIITVLGGVINIVLDYVFIVQMDMGIAGAGYATAIGNAIPTIIGTLYFIKGKSPIRFSKFKFSAKYVLDACINGSSEMVSNLSTGVTTMLFNIVMLQLLGNDGVAAITIVLYAQFFMSAIYLGFATTVAPVLSYNYGENNKPEIKKVTKYSFVFIIGASVTALILTFIIREPLTTVFATKGSNVYNIAHSGMGIFAFSFLFAGMNIFASSLFTAFGNGKVSAIISFLRTLVFIVIGILVLPKVMGVNGVWLSIVFAEMLSIVVSGYFLNKYKDVYGYNFSEKQSKDIMVFEKNS